MRLVTLLVALLTLAPVGRAADVADVADAADPPDVARELGRLSSSVANDRREAQRWLSVHLARADFPLVAESARAGGIEVRRRLAQAIAADERHLALAALLLSDPESEVSEVGEHAVAAMVEAWTSSARDQPLRRRTVPDPWAEDWPKPMSLDPEAGSLADVVDRLARLGAGPVPLVLDPSLDGAVRRFVPDRTRSQNRVEGPWTELLTQLARVHRVSFEVYGYRDSNEDGAGRARPWVRVCKRGDETETGAVEHMVEWCRGVVREHDARWNAACARALAMTSWPAAIAWFEERWLRTRDPAALDGLLVAAARGRVAPALARPERVRELLRDVDARLTASAPGSIRFAERVALALGAVGPAGPGGEALADVLLEGWATLGAESRWVRLVALEAHGRADAEAARVCRALLASAGSATTRLQALRTLVRVRGTDPSTTTIADPSPLIARARGEGRLEELARNLLAAGVVPRKGLDWRRLAVTAEERVALLGWSLGIGEDDRAREVLDALLDVGALATTGDRLRRWVGFGRGTAVRRLLDGARAEAAQDIARLDALARLAVLGGVASDVEQRVLLERSLAVDPPTAASLGGLAALAAADGDVGETARAGLVDALGTNVPVSVLRPALERAVEVLRRARLDDEDDAFQSLVRGTAARTGHALGELVYDAEWPPAAVTPPLLLELGDRRITP